MNHNLFGFEQTLETCYLSKISHMCFKSSDVNIDLFFN